MASPAQAFPFAGFPVHPAHDPMGLGKSYFNFIFSYKCKIFYLKSDTLQPNTDGKMF